MEMSVQFHAPATLPLYPLDRRLGGTQNRGEVPGERKHVVRDDDDDDGNKNKNLFFSSVHLPSLVNTG
jgi:hypothetical protein